MERIGDGDESGTANSEAPIKIKNGTEIVRLPSAPKPEAEPTKSPVEIPQTPTQ